METPDGLRYTEEHEWVRLEGNEAVIGITDYAQGELGDIVFVELPEVGAELRQGTAFGTIEAVKTVSDLFAPVSGTVAAVNDRLRDAPEIVNSAPYGDGWMVRLRVADAAETERLMSAADYRRHVGEGA
jgi:glycine cleavage system H protein